MAVQLEGQRIAFLVANDGVEQVELTEPWRVVQETGGQPILVAPNEGEVRARNHLDAGDTFPVDVTVRDALGQEFDGLVLPGGVANPDHLRTEPEAVRFVRSFFDAGKPVAAICHAPWTLIDAGAARGRTLTSWPSLRTDLTNAGAEWIDAEVHVDRNDGSPLVTSRKPDDLRAFTEQLVRTFSGSRTDESISTSVDTDLDVVGVLAAVRRDHRKIERLLDEVETHTGDARERAFAALVKELTSHEAAEEQIVHPLAKDVGAGRVARGAEREEKSARRVLAQFDGLDLSSGEFARAFARLKQDVKAHAEREEREEHPRIMEG